MPTDAELLAAAAAQSPQHAAAIQARLKWLHTARPNQITPPGDDWQIWLCMAGRFWGKTRVGAEDMWWHCFTVPGARGAVIAPTTGDLRIYCFEGPSGLKNVIPPEILRGGDISTAYNRSLFEIYFANGSLIQGFSAEDPDRLRGPGVTRAWCLAGDTIVTMGDGAPKRLDAIVRGDHVMTRRGPKRVLAAVMTNAQASVVRLSTEHTTLVGTTNHMVYTLARGFMPLGQLREGDELCFLKRSDTTGAAITFAPMVIIRQSDIAGWMSAACIARFTKTITAQFQRAFTFTTLMVIAQTMPSKILRRCQPANTLDIIGSANPTPIRPLPASQLPRLLRLGSRSLSKLTNALCARLSLSRGIRSLARSAARNVWSALGPIGSSLNIASATNAGSATAQRGEFNDFAENGAISDSPRRGTNQGERANVSTALSARSHSSQSASTPSFADDLAPSLSTAIVMGVESCPKLSAVYDLEIEDAHEFFANGILVHNCDELGAWKKQSINEAWSNINFMLREGADPRLIATTTPRPKPLIYDLVERVGKDVIMSTGSSMDNRRNIAASVFDRVGVYEGTKVGDQEIHGKLLNLEDSGIIKKQWIKQWPAAKPDGTPNPLPKFDFLIMSLDTAFTEKTLDKETGDPDPTGCEIWGAFTLPGEKPRDLFGKRVYPAMQAMLLDAWDDFLGFPELVKRVLAELKTEYGAADDAHIAPMIGPDYRVGTGRKIDLVVIEDKGSGISLRQTLAGAGIAAYAYNPGNADKLARLHMVSHVFSNGLVWVPEGRLVNKATGAFIRGTGKFASWADTAVEQWCTFAGEGSIAHDEHVDCASQGIRVLLNHGILLPVKRPEDEPTEGVYARPPSERVNPYAA